MKSLRSVLALALVGGLALCLANGEALAQKGKKGSFGRVTALKVDDNGVGTITIATKAKKDDTETMSKTFKVTKDTVVQKGGGKKGSEPTKAALSDIKAAEKDGTLVFITAADDGSAATITIVPGFKKKKDDA